MSRPLYAIMRVQKLKTRGDLAAAVKHNIRTYKGGHTIDGRPLPIELIPGDGRSIMKRADNVLKQHGVKPQAGQVLAVEMICTASREWFENADQAAVTDWLEQNVRFAQKLFGPGLISARLHLDEHTPHLHVLALPMTNKVVKKRGRKPTTVAAIERRKREEATPRWNLSYEAIFGGDGNRFVQLQDDYHASGRHLGLVRGEPSDRKHVPPSEYRKMLKARDAKLDEREAELEFMWEDFARREDLLRRKEQAAWDWQGMVARMEREANERNRIAQAALDASQEDHERAVRALAAERKAVENREDAARIARANNHEAGAILEERREYLNNDVAENQKRRRNLDKEKDDLDQQIAILEKMVQGVRKSALSDRKDDLEAGLTPDQAQFAAQPWPPALELARSLLRQAQGLAKAFRAKLKKIRQREKQVEADKTALKRRETAVQVRERDAGSREIRTAAREAVVAKGEAAMATAAARKERLTEQVRDLERRSWEGHALLQSQENRLGTIYVDAKSAESVRDSAEADRAYAEAKRSEIKRAIVDLEKQQQSAVRELKTLAVSTDELKAKEGRAAAAMDMVRTARNAVVEEAERLRRDGTNAARQAEMLGIVAAGIGIPVVTDRHFTVERRMDGSEDVRLERGAASPWFENAFRQAVALRQARVAQRHRETEVAEQARALQASAEAIEKLIPTPPPEVEVAKKAAETVRATMRTHWNNDQDLGR